MPNDDLNTQITKLKEENNKLQDKNDDLQYEINDLQDEVDGLQYQIDLLKEKEQKFNNNYLYIKNLFYDYKERIDDVSWFKKLDKFFIDTIDKK